MNVDIPLALLKQLTDSVIIVVGVVDASWVVLADELALAVRGVHLCMEDIRLANSGQLTGRRVLRASLLACSLLVKHCVTRQRLRGQASMNIYLRHRRGM